MNKLIHTTIEITLRIIAILCLLKAAKDKKIKVKAKIRRVADKVYKKWGTTAGYYIDSLMYDSRVRKLIENISDAELAAMAIDYISEFNVSLYPYKSMNGIEGTTEFQVILSEKGFTQEHLKKYDEMCDGKPKNRLYSLLYNVVAHFFSSYSPSACINSPGSKVKMCQKMNKDKLLKNPDKPDELWDYLVDPFARTCSFSFFLRDKVKRFIINDKDIEVVNYLICLKLYTPYLINAIFNEINSEEFKRLKASVTDPSSFSKEKVAYTDRLNHALKGIKSINKINQMSIRAAACFFMKVNLSFNGMCKDINKNRVLGIMDKLVRSVPRMFSAARVLQRAEITCKDGLEIIKQYSNLKNTLFIIDTPYITKAKIDDGAYNLKFTFNAFKKIAKIAQNLEHVILTHKELDIVRDLFPVEDGGFSRISYSNPFGKSSYVTDVYYKGVDPDVFGDFEDEV